MDRHTDIIADQTTYFKQNNIVSYVINNLKNTLKLICDKITEKQKLIIMSTPSITESYSLVSYSATPSPYNSSPFLVDSQPVAQGDKMVCGEVEDVLKESGKILRLTQIDQALPKFLSMRKRLIGELNKALSLDTAADAIEALTKLNPKFGEIYAPVLNSATDVPKKLKSLSKELQSIATTSPVTSSTLGKQGPTLLVSYPTLQGNTSYVAKCSDRIEPVSHRVYRAFSGLFSNENLSCGFLTPHASRFDFHHNIHESTSREQTPLSSDLSSQLKNNFTVLAKTANTNKELNPDATHLMLMEKIKGPNLFDFVFTDYKGLSDEKKAKLFERLGRLAALDFVLGNRDRLLQIDSRNGRYRIERPTEANLGNVMIISSQEDKNFHLYAIDNGIDPDLINNKEKNSNYADFLVTHFHSRRAFKRIADAVTASRIQEPTFSNQVSKKIADYLVAKPIDRLVDNILGSMESGVAAQMDEIKDPKNPAHKNLANIQQNVQSFFHDLSSVTQKGTKTPRDAVYHGVKTMIEWLHSQALPHLWEKSEEGIALRKYLQDVYPEYLQSIQERFNAFKGITL